MDPLLELFRSSPAWASVLFGLLSIFLSLTGFTLILSTWSGLRTDMIGRGGLGLTLCVLGTIVAFLPGCAALSGVVGGVKDNPEVAQAAVVYGTAKLVEETSVTSEQVFEVADSIEIVVSGEGVGEFALSEIESHVPFESLSSSDRFLARSLINYIVSELQERAVERSVEPGSVSVSDVRTVLTWVREGALLAEEPESDPTASTSTESIGKTWYEPVLLA